MPRPPSSRPGSLGAKIRRRRQARGLSVAALAGKAGVSRSYLSLIENGDRGAGDDLLEALARALDDPPDVYLDWASEEAARGNARDLEESVLEPLARNELRGPGEAPRMLNVEVKVAKPSSVAEVHGRLPHAGSRVPSVPIVKEGTRLKSTRRGAEVDYVSIDPAVVSERERFVRPFAWKLSKEGVAHAADMLEPGDTVVISQDPGTIVEDELYAVRDSRDAIVLSRVQIKGDVLLLVDQDGKARDALAPRKGSPLSHIVGKVVIVIRPWRYAVLTPHAKK